jgi:23S rRNA-/tRNA-specific pseudouridylate synthase
VRLDRWFKRHLPQVSFAMVSRWARTGQIRVDGKRADVDTRLTTGQVLRVPPAGGPLPLAGGGKGARARKPLTEEQIHLAEDIVLEQDRAAIIINKPPGLATQGGSGTHEHVDGLLDAYAHDGDPRPRLVHRLDKDTSGVMVAAKSDRAHQGLSALFATHDIERTYIALTRGAPTPLQGRIETRIGRSTADRKKMAVLKTGGREAITDYRVQRTFGEPARAGGAPGPSVRFIPRGCRSGSRVARQHDDFLGRPQLARQDPPDQDLAHRAGPAGDQDALAFQQLDRPPTRVAATPGVNEPSARAPPVAGLRTLV